MTGSSLSILVVVFATCFSGDSKAEPSQDPIAEMPTEEATVVTDYHDGGVADTETGSQNDSKEPVQASDTSNIPDIPDKPNNVDSTLSTESAETTDYTDTENISNTAVNEQKNSSPTVDAVLVTIRDKLLALTSSTLQNDVVIGSLFTFPLDDPKAIANRISQLREELNSLSTNLARTNERLLNPSVEIAKIPRPAELDQPLIEPLPPVEPIEPEKPTVRRPQGKPHPKRKTAWLERFAVWEEYDGKLAEFTEKKIKFEAELLDYQNAQEEFQKLASKREDISKEFEAAIRKRNDEVEQLRLDLTREVADIDVRIEILRLRLTYITALSKMLGQLTEPALAAFAGLKSKRTSIRARVDDFGHLTRSLDALLIRLEGLGNRTKSGALIGFEANREQLAQDTATVADAMKRRRESMAKLEIELLESADEIERQAAAIRRLILIQAANPKKNEVIDKAFLKYLGEMRSGAQRLSLSIKQDQSKAEFKSLLEAIGQALASPDSIGKVSEGENELDGLKVLVERLDTHIDENRVDLERYHQAFRREAVTVLSGLASDGTRRKAYSLSRELVADFIADIENLKTSLTSWIRKKGEDIVTLPTKVKTRAGVFLITRVVAAVIIIFILVLLRKRIGRIVASGIRRFSASRFFKHRLGSLVRWAGLAEALLPTVVFASVGYAVLALLGFDKPEVRFVEVAVRWTVAYALGRRFLEGLTRRVSRGRPAFISISSDNAVLLSKTYGRLGLFAALGGVAYEWADAWLGAGLLSTLVVWSVWLWLGIWGLWGLISWRVPLAQSLVARTKEGQVIGRLGKWMEAHRIGAAITAFALLWLIVGSIVHKLRVLLAEGGLFAYLRARSLKRMARTAKRDNTTLPPPALPELYIKEFPLYPIYGEEDAVLLPREALITSAMEQLEKWRATRQDGSLVIVGEKGIGKTTFLTLLENRLSSMKVTRYSLTKKLRSEKALVKELGEAFGVEDPGHTGALASHLMKGEERVVLLDEAHNVFLRTVGGYEAYDALIRLVNYTSEKVFWVLVFNSFSWTYLNESRKRVHYFRRLLRLPSWNRNEIMELISKRNKRSGLEIEFDEMLLDEARSTTGDFEVIDGAEGFFRLLWEASLGNPRVATRLWLESLRPVSDSRIVVGLFTDTLGEEFTKMDRELFFALAAVCQHENLSVAELREVTNVSADFAGFAMRFLSEYGLLEPKHTDPRRLTLAPRYYPQVLKVLRQQHLLLEKE